MRLLSGVPAPASTSASAAVSYLPSSLLSFACAIPRRMPTAAAASSAAAGDGGAQKPWLFVGLGNPGKMFQGTRHNVGFEMIDVIAEAEGISVNIKQFKAIVGKGVIGDVPVMLAKPQTFINSSGWAACFIFQDTAQSSNFDLPFGKLRLPLKGGHGGHNGMKSIISYLKQNRDFPSLRIGIGRPPGEMDPGNFVLRPFSKQEQEELFSWIALDFMFHKGLQAVRIMVLEGFNKSATFVDTAQPSEMFNR